MQIASIYKNCSDKSETSKEIKLPSVRKKTTSSVRARGFAKFQQHQKLRQRHNDSCCYQHRLDHTYAATVNFNDVKIIVIDEEDDAKPNNQEPNGAEKGTESLQLGCEMSKNPELLNGDNNNDTKMKNAGNGTELEEHVKKTHSTFNGNKSILKQYQRNRKSDKRPLKLLPTSFYTTAKIHTEEKKRWIAALALIELAKST